MVRIKLQVSVAFILAAAAIAPVVALPVTLNNGSVLYSVDGWLTFWLYIIWSQCRVECPWQLWNERTLLWTTRVGLFSLWLSCFLKTPLGLEMFLRVGFTGCLTRASVSSGLFQGHQKSATRTNIYHLHRFFDTSSSSSLTVVWEHLIFATNIRTVYPIHMLSRSLDTSSERESLIDEDPESRL